MMKISKQDHQKSTIKVEHNKAMMSPSIYPVPPLYEAVNSLISKFNELFISNEPQHEDSSSNGTDCKRC